MAVVDFLVVDTAAFGAAAKGIGVAKLLLRSFHACNSLCLSDSHAEPLFSSSPSFRVLQISSVSNAIDAVAPPTVKSISCRVPRRTLLRRKRRTKRRLSGDGSENVGHQGFFSGDDGDGPFWGDGGGFGGSGGGWNFNRFGEGHDWDESSSSHSDPAFDFVYEVLSWIMLSNCLHFAFKRIVRWASGGIVGADSGKVSRKLAPTARYLILHRNLCF